MTFAFKFDCIGSPVAKLDVRVSAGPKVDLDLTPDGGSVDEGEDSLLGVDLFGVNCESSAADMLGGEILEA